MFTGLVSQVGRVRAVEPGGLRIACAYPADSLQIGGSLACDGCCLTLTDIQAIDNETVFAVDLSKETRARSTLGAWTPGRRVNLERPLRLQDELGGHLVTGHVDGVAHIRTREQETDSVRFSLDAPPGLARFIAAKGSVCLDGVSLTVNTVDRTRFGITIIPHTLAVTTWGDRRVGDAVNLEVDLLARYVARIGEAMLRP